MTSQSPGLFLEKAKTAREVTKSAKEYWRRVCKIHDEEVTELFGHDVRKVKEMSQVDIFSQSDAESSQDPDSSDSSSSPPVKRRMTRSLARHSRATE
ncbi:hypothetical protein ONE63_001637 [Megalurothrips usitatus]|uniref:Uncharacterized protein n=1 Tax=Megalurothrips usitatus TaxID=439358 RepID=A0AAV7XCX9_9NEOP|nr:hypothetical protein ONE63_001637 [Megalurothrips usitatus]